MDAYIGPLRLRLCDRLLRLSKQQNAGGRRENGSTSTDLVGVGSIYSSVDERQIPDGVSLAILVGASIQGLMSIDNFLFYFLFFV